MGRPFVPFATRGAATAALRRMLTPEQHAGASVERHSAGFVVVVLNARGACVMLGRRGVSRPYP